MGEAAGPQSARRGLADEEQPPVHRAGQAGGSGPAVISHINILVISQHSMIQSWLAETSLPTHSHIQACTWCTHTPTHVHGCTHPRTHAWIVHPRWRQPT